jgi:hypothetical protein
LHYALRRTHDETNALRIRVENELLHIRQLLKVNRLMPDQLNDLLLLATDELDKLLDFLYHSLDEDLEAVIDALQHHFPNTLDIHYEKSKIDLLWSIQNVENVVSGFVELVQFSLQVLKGNFLRELVFQAFGAEGHYEG